MSYPKKKFSRAIIDGDLLLYEIASATQKNIYDIYIDGTLAYTGSEKMKINEMFRDIDYGFERYVLVQPILSAIDTYKTIIKGYEKMFDDPDKQILL